MILLIYFCSRIGESDWFLPQVHRNYSYLSNFVFKLFHFFFDKLFFLSFFPPLFLSLYNIWAIKAAFHLSVCLFISIVSAVIFGVYGKDVGQLFPVYCLAQVPVSCIAQVRTRAQVKAQFFYRQWKRSLLEMENVVRFCSTSMLSNLTDIRGYRVKMLWFIKTV